MVAVVVVVQAVVVVVVVVQVDPVYIIMFYDMLL